MEQETRCWGTSKKKNINYHPPTCLCENTLSILTRVLLTSCTVEVNKKRRWPSGQSLTSGDTLTHCCVPIHSRWRQMLRFVLNLVCSQFTLAHLQDFTEGFKVEKTMEQRKIRSGSVYQLLLLYRMKIKKDKSTFSNCGLLHYKMCSKSVLNHFHNENYKQHHSPILISFGKLYK